MHCVPPVLSIVYLQCSGPALHRPAMIGGYDRPAMPSNPSRLLLLEGFLVGVGALHDDGILKKHRTLTYRKGERFLGT